MTTYRIKINGKDLTVNLLSHCANNLTFQVGNQTYSTSIEHELKPDSKIRPLTLEAAANRIQDLSPQMSSGPLLAPMPGLVVKVLVKEGQSVKLGQALLTVEAMKMENSVPSNKDGTIKKILVKAGDEVQSRQPLIEFT